ncbi:MAG: DUF3617 family protein [Spirochaetia bacterium]|nr:DUF3617 family protein [Spirochaetia bacterium]
MNMLTKQIFSIKISLALGLLTLFFYTGCKGKTDSGPNLEEGSWEIQYTMKMEGMPFPVPPVKINQCMNKTDAVPQGKQNEDCKITEKNITGNTVHWKSVCGSGKDQTSAEGDITYNGNSMNGKMKITTGKNTMEQEISGNRTGPCSK